jgi:hypothetical protein
VNIGAGGGAFVYTGLLRSAADAVVEIAARIAADASSSFFMTPTPGFV